MFSQKDNQKYVFPQKELIKTKYIKSQKKKSRTLKLYVNTVKDMW